MRKMGIAAEIRRSPVRPAIPEARHTPLTILLQIPPTSLPGKLEAISHFSLGSSSC